MPQHLTITLLAGLAPLLAGSGGTAATIYVDAAAPPGGDGTSWASAYDDLHEGLAAAGAGDAVWVATGTYAPDGPGGSRAASFTLPGGVSLYGGFAGDESSPEERDVSANPTVLTGDLDGDDGPGFTGRADNSYHVVIAGGDPATSVIDGCTIVGGNANAGSAGSPLRNGGGIYVDAGSLTVRGCAFEGNEALGGVPYSGGGAIFARDGAFAIESSSFRRNRAASSHGGGVRIAPPASATVIGCTFDDNEADVGGGLSAEGLTSLDIEGCTFVGNYAEAGAGGFFAHALGTLDVRGTSFLDNNGGFTGGGVIFEATTASFVDCPFAENTATDRAGAMGLLAVDATLVNCAFSRNSAGEGGGIQVAGSANFINCTFSDNQGGAITTETSANSIALVNSIVWGNAPTPFSGPVAPAASFSDIEGGWPGSGNIDADPLFVQAGTDDLRLAFGSPALDAGSNAAVPAGVDTDLAGAPRIQNGIVDMGAYEGAFDPMPAAAMAGDLDGGETAVLIFGDGSLDPLTNTMLVVANVAGPDDAYAIATDHDDDAHAGAAGYEALAGTLAFTTNIADGAFHACVIRPFDAADLDGADPFDVDLTAFSAATGAWALAVSTNSATSPGHSGPIGDRITTLGPGPYGVTQELGDYGVYWDAGAGQGMVWANLDRAGDSTFGISTCPADAAQPPDGFADMADILAVIANWGEGAGPFDVDDDGTVGAGDLLAVIAAWGTCP